MIWTYLVCLGCALTIERPGEKLAEESCAAAGGDDASLVEHNAPKKAAARCCCPTQSSDGAGWARGSDPHDVCLRERDGKLEAHAPMHFVNPRADAEKVRILCDKRGPHSCSEYDVKRSGSQRKAARYRYVQRSHRGIAARWITVPQTRLRAAVLQSTGQHWSGSIYFKATDDFKGAFHTDLPAYFYKPRNSTAPDYIDEIDGGPKLKEAYCLEGEYTLEETYTSHRTGSVPGTRVNVQVRGEDETVFTRHWPLHPCGRETGFTWYYRVGKLGSCRDKALLPGFAKHAYALNFSKAVASLSKSVCPHGEFHSRRAGACVCEKPLEECD
jgi:hypothetical protein